jgi:hypothetical protein
MNARTLQGPTAGGVFLLFPPLDRESFPALAGAIGKRFEVYSRAAPVSLDSTIAEPACQGTVFEVRMECQNHGRDMPVTRFNSTSSGQPFPPGPW